MKGNNCMLEIIYVQKCLHWDSVGPLQHLTQSFWRILLLIKTNKKSSKALVASTKLTVSRSRSEQSGSCSNLRLFGKMHLYWGKCKHLPGAQQGGWVAVSWFGGRKQLWVWCYGKCGHCLDIINSGGALALLLPLCMWDCWNQPKGLFVSTWL